MVDDLEQADPPDQKLDMSAGLEQELVDWLASVGYDANGWPRADQQSDPDARLELRPGDVRILLMWIRGFQELIDRQEAAKALFVAGEAPGKVLEAFGLKRPSGRRAKRDPSQVMHIYRILTKENPSTETVEIFPDEPPVRRPVSGVEAIKLVQRRWGFTSEIETLKYLEKHRARIRKAVGSEGDLAELFASDIKLPSRSGVEKP